MIATKFLGSLGFASVALAGTLPAQAGRPKDATGQCTDGTYTTAATKQRGCAKHGGVKTWYADTAPAGAPAPAPTPAPAPRPKTPPTAMPAPVPPPAPAPASQPAPAPGAGGPGQVWVNSESHVYHCSGSRYYGKTKKGQYMTEAAATAAGNHADHGKGCGQ